jgi:hypothetical protein
MWHEIRASTTTCYWDVRGKNNIEVVISSRVSQYSRPLQFEHSESWPPPPNFRRMWVPKTPLGLLDSLTMVHPRYVQDPAAVRKTVLGLHEQDSRPRSNLTRRRKLPRHELTELFNLVRNLAPFGRGLLSLRQAYLLKAHSIALTQLTLAQQIQHRLQSKPLTGQDSEISLYLLHSAPMCNYTHRPPYS